MISEDASKAMSTPKLLARFICHFAVDAKISASTHTVACSCYAVRVRESHRPSGALRAKRTKGGLDPGVVRETRLPQAGICHAFSVKKPRGTEAFAKTLRCCVMKSVPPRDSGWASRLPKVDCRLPIGVLRNRPIRNRKSTIGNGHDPPACARWY
jgi:hypothetical protein